MSVRKNGKKLHANSSTAKCLKKQIPLEYLEYLVNLTMLEDCFKLIQC